MASVSLTKMDGWNNCFFTLLGVPALSLSHGEVGGRCFWFGRNPLFDHEVPWWKGGDPEEEQPNRRYPLPAEDSNPLERVAHAANASPLWSVHTTNFARMASTTERVVLTCDRAAPPYVQLANKLFADFRSASAVVKTAYSPSRELVCWDWLRLDELDFDCQAAPPGTLEDLGRDWPWQKQCRATSPFLLVLAVTDEVERYLPRVSNREGIV
jgi:hypothetical protein